MDDAEFDWTGRTMSTPVSDLTIDLHLLCVWFYHLNIIYPFYQVQNQDPISPSGRGRHNTGKEGGKGTPAWSESKPSGINILEGRLGQNTHPSVQVHRGSTNMDLSRDDDGGATQDRSNAPITTTNDPEQVSETKCCCFFKRKMRKKKTGRSK